MITNPVEGWQNSCGKVLGVVWWTEKIRNQHLVKYVKNIYLLVAFFTAFSCRKTDTIPTEKRILQFKFSGTGTSEIQIDDATGEILVLIPYGTPLKSLLPVFTLTPGTTSVPASGKPQDFSVPVHYILTGADGSQVVYTVRVKSAPQPAPQITTIEKDTLEAGQFLRVTGRHFGQFALDAAVHLIGAASEKIPLPVQALDSTSLTLSLPLRTPPGSYQINVQIKNAVTVSAQSMVITLPPPQITGLPQKHLLPGDTLWPETDFTDLLRNIYRLQLRAENNKTFSLPMASNPTRSFGFLIPVDFLAGRYSVSLLNMSQAKRSADWSERITVYDRSKPFVRDIASPQASYQLGATVSFSTINMAGSTARFYQISLFSPQKTVVRNALFDWQTQQLRLDLPNTLVPGNYQVSVRFIHDNPAADFSVGLDRELAIH